MRLNTHSGGEMKIAGSRMLAFSVCAIISLSIALGGQNAKDKSKDKGGKKDSAPAHATVGIEARVAVDVFSAGDRNLILNHFRANRGRDLPPGLVKQLHRNGHLPPGLEKKITAFPLELERTLPPLKPGLIRGIVGGSAVIMNSRTRLILDVVAIL